METLQEQLEKWGRDRLFNSRIRDNASDEEKLTARTIVQAANLKEKIKGLKKKAKAAYKAGNKKLGWEIRKEIEKLEALHRAALAKRQAVVESREAWKEEYAA